MRSPVIAFSIMAAAAVSPNLVAGAPTSPNPDTSVTHSPRQLPGGLPGLPGGVSPAALKSASNPMSAVMGNSALSNIMNPSSNTPKNTKPDPGAHRAAEQQLHNPSSSVDSYTSRRKRAMDMNSAGGNAYTGAGGDTSGGDVVAASKQGFDGDDEDEEDEFPGTLNEEAVTGGAGGDGYSGFAYGGDGDGKGAGGNAYSGAVANSVGGNAITTAQDGVVENEAPVAGGVGGYDQSGDAQGGDAAGNIVDGVNTNVPKRKRGMDMGTAGGNAYTGASSDVDGGDVINHTDSDGEIENDDTQAGGDAGDTYSGDADGGDGDGYGPGGNAYSGATGSAVGGSVVNVGGEVDNEEAVTGGTGGESESGDATGGDA